MGGRLVEPPAFPVQLRVAMQAVDAFDLVLDVTRTAERSSQMAQRLPPAMQKSAHHSREARGAASMHNRRIAFKPALQPSSRVHAVSCELAVHLAMPIR